MAGKPTIRVDVFDRFAERKAGGSVKIATIEATSERGRLEVLDPRFEALLRELFEEPRWVRRGEGGTLPDGTCVDPAAERLEPWTEEALESAVSEGLPAHNLRGEVKKPR